MSCTTVSSNDLGHLKCMGWLSLPKSPFSLKLLHLQSRDRWPSQTMLTVLFSLRDCFRARAVLQAEILALRHQLLVLQCVSPEVRNLIRKMSLASPRWGAPRIHGELLKIGIAVSQATVAKYMVRHRKPPSQTWRTFLKNHAKDLVSADFFVVPTITFQLLFVFVILDHDRRRPIHFAVTSNPTAEWTARQLLEAFPWDNAPRYLLRDRDSIYGEKFCETAKWLGIREVLTAPRSPWQNAYAERLIGSIRRECLDHVLVFREAGLRQTLKQYFAYYERCRTHLSLKKDAPVGRPVEPPSFGEVIQIPQVGGLHHLYTRKAA